MEIESNFTTNQTNQHEASFRYLNILPENSTDACKNFSIKRSRYLNVPSRPQRKRVFICFAVIFFFFNFSLYAQEAVQNEETKAEETSIPEEEPEEAVSPLSYSERRRTEMEIRTSTLSELALWCRTLGLSESGTREVLSKRIREHFRLPEPSDQNRPNQKIITIESAQTTEYFSIGVIDEDYARLKGNVKISLKDGDDIHIIIADEILFNRTRNIITARGNVIYEKTSADTIETFRGVNITVNLDDWSSVFLDGSSEKKLDSDGTSYLFSGEVISRSGEDVTILSDARISSADNEEALWSIDASRLWLLPGSDFAIFNALLKVGEIPVLYLPFFYFPADELVFHPVLGYRSREGGFIQTTTYILGQPKASESETSSLTKIMGNSDDKEKELHGLFLRNTGKKAIDPNSLSLKVLMDYYVNLGAFAGIEFAMPKTGILNPLRLEIGAGFSRTITRFGNYYTPYYPNYDGTFDWNNSNLFSFSVPFRYRINLNSSLSGKYGSLSWDLPYYSDPYIDRDFKNRAESMDFFNMVQQGAVTEDPALARNEIGTYKWHISASLNPTFDYLSPVISKISISNIFSTLMFKPTQDEYIAKNKPDDPGRFFYAPDKLTIYSLSASITGTPLTIGGSAVQKPTEAADEKTENILSSIGEPIPPWKTQDNEDSENEKIVSENILTPPVYNHSVTLPGTRSAKFVIDYQLSPTSTTDLQFMGFNRWKTYDQVDWSEVQSIQTILQGRAVLNFRLDHTDGFYSNVVSFTGDGVWQDFTYLNEDAEAYLDSQGGTDPLKVEKARQQQYSRTNYHSIYSYNGTVRPFNKDPIFGQSSLQYSFRGTLVKSKKYDPNASPNSPELTPQWGTWAKEKTSEDILGLTSHQLAANLAANVMDKNQSISVSAALPPLDGSVNTNATFRFWISETNVNFRIEKPEISNEWLVKPINITETLRFSSKNTFIYFMVIDPEKNNDITSIRSTLTLHSFITEFTAAHTRKWVFETVSGNSTWVQKGEPALFPNNLTFSYNPAASNFELIKDRVNFRLNFRTSLKFNLMKYTESSFNLALGFTLSMPKFLDIEFSATSTNNVIWRYFKGVPGMENLTYMYIDGPQNNFFIDLFDSFNFFDDSKRRRSGFKMGALDIKAIHYLGDWTADLSVKIYPDQKTDTRGSGYPRYEIVTDISFMVTWIPISEIKTNFVHTGDTGKWEIK